MRVHPMPCSASPRWTHATPAQCSLQARALWEQRISTKWEAYWAVRKPKIQEVPTAETNGPEKRPEITKGESTSLLIPIRTHG